VAGAPIDFETVLLDPTTDNYDDLYSAIQSVKRNGCGIKGNIETKINRPDIKSRNVEMRNALDLFVNRVMCKSQPGIKTRHEDIDIVVSTRNRTPSSVVYPDP
jgi:isocitrate dehydrogenase (NAD+)